MMFFATVTIFTTFFEVKCFHVAPRRHQAIKQKKSGQLFTANRLNSHGAPGAIRTHGLWLRRPTLYPAELRAHKNCLDMPTRPPCQGRKKCSTYRGHAPGCKRCRGGWPPGLLPARPQKTPTHATNGYGYSKRLTRCKRPAPPHSTRPTALCPTPPQSPALRQEKPTANGPTHSKHPRPFVSVCV